MERTNDTMREWREAQAARLQRPRCPHCSQGRGVRRHLTRAWDYYECDRCGMRWFADKGEAVAK